MDLHVRGVPDQVHAVLVRRAAERGMSLRAYLVDLLSTHAAAPTMEEWLDVVHALPRVGDGRRGAALVEEARAEADAHLPSGARGDRVS
jgi:hypothetical protein